MFALEIIFRDSSVAPETVFVRRPQALVGSHDFAHVMIEDMKSLDYQIRAVKDVGRRFKIFAVSGGTASATAASIEGTYDSEASLALGPVSLNFTSLDSDLIQREGETPDRAGIRVLRQACSKPPPIFPAIVVVGGSPVAISFLPDQPITIGRSKQCTIRLDSAEVSGSHAKLGFENGRFWVEDLGSTNGTFVEKQQVGGRVDVEPGQSIVLGREVTIVGVINEEGLLRASRVVPIASNISQGVEERYPIVTSVSEVCRPAKLTLTPGSSINIGRDPTCEMWMGAPHVSRMHCSIAMTRDGEVLISDNSKNGTSHEEGVLKKGDKLFLGGKPKVIDFGGGVTVAVCFNLEQERKFVDSRGAPQTFLPEGSSGGAGINELVVRRGDVALASLPNTVLLARDLLNPLVMGFRSLRTQGRVGFFLIIIGVVVVVFLLSRVILQGFST